MAARIGERWLAQPMRGAWPVDELPELVRLHGRRFRRAAYWLPKPGVVAQYRQEVAKDALHLYVLADGSYVIDHSDDANPDAGPLIDHWLADTSSGQVVGMAVVLTAALGFVLGCRALGRAR